ncbi:hypothetical protein CPB83DRAFT_909857 [Crepidotus variabilis]|uniref:F-box domain-containing protein n=1 Tax=Crepidotus variabilis TaxID=179855 RepID=A0A9P6E8R8_9AGAR|nr:hypothetical protein CPB83DRAFT_909857 [Crepidotus variabilis]
MASDDGQSTLASLFDTFPPEVIADIFWHSLPVWSLETPCPLSDGPNNEFSVFDIGAVCQSWRKLAWSAPILWSAVRVCVDVDRAAMQTILLDQWLSRSGSLPLDVCLTLSKDVPTWTPGSEPDSAVVQLVAVAGKYANRWRSFVYEIPRLFHKALPPRHTPLPLLRFLKIDPLYNDSRRQNPIFLQAPLQYIALNGIHIEWLQVSFDKVMELRLSEFYLDECLFVLSQCLMVAHIVLEDVTFDYSEDPFKFDYSKLPIHLPSLRCLELRGRIKPLDIVTENLIELTYSGLNSHGIPLLCSLLPPILNLHRVCLLDCDVEPPEMLGVLEELQTVRSFEISAYHSRYVVHQVLDEDLVGRLRRSLEKSVLLLPNMEEFVYRGPRSFTWDSLITAWKEVALGYEEGSVESVVVQRLRWDLTFTLPGRDIPQNGSQRRRELDRLQIQSNGRLTLRFPDQENYAPSKILPTTEPDVLPALPFNEDSD